MTPLILFAPSVSRGLNLRDTNPHSRLNSRGRSRFVVVARVGRRIRAPSTSSGKKKHSKGPTNGNKGSRKVTKHREDEVDARARLLNLESCPALVLNADYQPLSYFPLSLWPWQDVMKAVFLERVNIVEVYDIGVRSCRDFFPLPSVISLKRYQSLGQKIPAFTRFNVFLRDDFECQYCGGRFVTQDLTFDHVMPRCEGGKTNWQNVVTACVGCNLSKGRQSLKSLKGRMQLLTKPVEPSTFDLQRNAKKYPPQYLHHTWRDYVYWSATLDE